MTNQTFSEYLKTNPNLYDGIAIDDATKENIFEWFQFREVCDNVKFGAFFRRELNIDLYRYNQLIRADLTEIDPMVNTYRERLLKTTGETSNTGSDTSETKKEGSFTREIKDGGTDTSTATRTPDLTTTNTPGVTTTQETEYGKTNTRNGEQTETPGVKETTQTTGKNTGKQANKSMPQSISYSGASDGNLPNFDWQYPSNQTQQENDINNTVTLSRTGQNTIEYNDIKDQQGGTDTTKTSQTGSDKLTETGTDKTDSKVTYGKTQTITETPQGQKETTTETKGTKQSNTHEDKEIWTGRDGLTPQEALQQLKDYIRGTNAMEWLIGKLEACFIGIFEV